MSSGRTYNSVVLVKQVPDTHHITGEVMKKDGTMNRGALPAIFNPEDLNALEMALQVRDRYGGQVTVMTMGPPKAAEVLRESLYRGADRVVLLTDKRFAGADTLATSYTLKCAIEKLGDQNLTDSRKEGLIALVRKNTLRLTELSSKIQRISQYAAKDYVDGKKIFDIDAAAGE